MQKIAMIGSVRIMQLNAISHTHTHTIYDALTKDYMHRINAHTGKASQLRMQILQYGLSNGII